LKLSHLILPANEAITTHRSHFVQQSSGVIAGTKARPTSIAPQEDIPSSELQLCSEEVAPPEASPSRRHKKHEETKIQKIIEAKKSGKEIEATVDGQRYSYKV
jgi:hypothetical protein